MPDLDLLKGIVKESSELSKRGRHSEALSLIDDAIADANRRNRASWVKTLCQHASVISHSIEDIGRMRYYCEQIVRCDPHDALAGYALANALLRQGEIDLARQQAIKSYGLIAHSNTEEDKGLVELIRKTWPDIGVPPGLEE